nr:MAG: hypothetical protein [Bacteriophage sp.]
MAKKIRKRRANYFDVGGFSWQKGAGFGKNMSNAFNSGALSGTIGAASSMAGQGISGGLSSGVGNAMQGLGSIASAIPGPWGAIAGAGLNIVGGLVNKAFGSQINEQAVQEAKAANMQQSNMQFAASNMADLLDQSNFGLLGNIKRSDIGKDGWFSNKAKNLTAKLNRQREIANQQAIANFRATAENVDTQNDLNALANYAAYGGPLTMRYTGTMSPFGNTFADGGNIHIKPENRGKFTRLKERTGKSSTWYKEHGTPEQKKMATFALNARKWKHAFGGDLNTNGGDFSNGLIMIGNGGTHEENPMEGVQMGMDAQGIPNLVEEGEVIFNDYVFSNRMKVPKAVRSKYKLREKKGITFADAAKKIAKESEERPNDPISQNGLKAMLGELATVQEDERFKKQMKDPEFRQQAMNQLSMQGQQYAQGGLLGRKYAGLGEVPNILGTPDQTDPYAFYGNMGRNKVTNTRIAQGWSNFTDNNGNMLYDPEKGTYSPDYLDFRFQSWLGSNYGKLSKDWWNSTNAPDYFKAGNKSAPTFDQMVGTIFNPGLMYDKKYGEAHDFGRYAYNQYKESLKPAPLTLSGEKIKGVELPKLSQISVLGSNSDETKRYPTWMRYAPIAAAGVGVLTDALGWTNKPDYSNADAILDATANGGNYMPVSATPLGDYLTYNPFDRNYYINKLNAESGATRRAIVNQSAGNRATALAGLLAADYNTQGKLGDLARQAEEYNLGQREKVATFNRGTNQFNSEMGLKAAMANQSALANLRDYRLRGTMAAAEMREKARMLADANRSTNLTNFVQGLGDIGSENVGWNQLQWAIEHGVFGPMQGTPNKGYETSRKKKNGGKLLTKKI